MVLGFNFRFIKLILNGDKQHTIRIDKTKRWKKGMKIHFATGTRTKNYRQFDEGTCKDTQRIDIEYPKCELTGEPIGRALIKIDGQYLDEDSINELIDKDGFASRRKDFWDWFSEDMIDGTLIHWKENNTY